MTEHSQPVIFDPRSFDPSALGGVDNRDVRVAMTRTVVNALREHGIITRSFEGRHPLDDSNIGHQVWTLVRSLPCVAGRTVEEEFKRWPSSGSAPLALAGLVKCLLAALARREQLRAELAALEVIGAIEQREASDWRPRLAATLKAQFPQEQYP